MFNKNSELVKVWVGLVSLGVYEAEQIPKQGNLKDVVLEVVKELTGDVAAPVEQPAEQPIDLMAAAQ